MTSKTTEGEDTEVFDVADWLDRATVNRPATDYVPKHRAEDSTG